MRCANCDKPLGGDSFKTAYGDWLCEDCWDDYICSDVGRLEYFIGFCREDYHPDEFDADFVYEAVKSYRINYNQLDFTAEQLTELENKAKELGLL
jgi:hypothetical protein